MSFTSNYQLLMEKMLEFHQNHWDFTMKFRETHVRTGEMKRENWRCEYGYILLDTDQIDNVSTHH